MQLWTTRVAAATGFDRVAQRAEANGWDGITVTDSQNLAPDPFVAITVGALATERLRLGTGVTNAATRHPAALATVAATVQEVSNGRFTLGIGRGDTALFHLHRPPMPVADFDAAVTQLHTYLQGGEVDLDGFPSRIHWLDRSPAPEVPLDIAASGPKLLALAGRLAERVTVAVGADPDRIPWAFELTAKAAADAGRPAGAVATGAYVNIACHPDLDTARGLIAGTVAAFAHFSAMPGSTGAGLAEADREIVAEVGRTYDSRQHLRNDSPQTKALDPDFVERFAVVGDPDRCVERLLELHRLGVERFVLIGPGIGADREAASLANRLLVSEVLPALRAADKEDA